MLPSPVTQATCASGKRELDAEGGRQSETHGAEPAGINPTPWLVEGVELGRPHLMLADIRSDVGIAMGHFVELLQHVLGFDGVARGLVTQAVD